MTTIAIIGTAGRKDDKKRLTAKTYADMTVAVEKIITENITGPTHLISGGAAWADHLAVTLFLRGLCQELSLYLPVEFGTMGKKQFKDTGVIDWRTNPGGTSNFYHKEFSSVIGRDTLVEIADAIDEGAKIVEGGGFFGRNILVAKNSEHIISLTFGAKEVLKDGGTANTMEAYLKYREQNRLPDNSWHVDLNTMKIHKGAKVV